MVQKRCYVCKTPLEPGRYLCSHCGAKRPKGKAWVFIPVVLVVAVIAVWLQPVLLYLPLMLLLPATCPGDGPPLSASPAGASQAAAYAEASSAASNAVASSVIASNADASPPRYAALSWQYGGPTGDLVRHTYASAPNQTDAEAPQVDSRLSLRLRSWRSSEPEALIEAEGTWLRCAPDDCVVRIRFNERPFEVYTSGRLLADDRADTLVIREHQRFVTALRAADSVTLEVKTGLEGPRRFRFELDGFRW